MGYSADSLPSEYFDREPDHVENSDEHSLILQLWMPVEEQGGLAILKFNHGGNPEDNPSPYEGIKLVRDVESAVRTLGDLTATLPALYDYLGVTVNRTTEQVELGFPHNQTLVRRIGTLSLAGDLHPPEFILQPDGIYSAETYLKHLAHDQAFVIATDGPYAVHDLVTHTLTAQMLVPPDGMTILGAKSQAALQSGDATVMGQLMNKLDSTLSSGAYGYAVNHALSGEGKVGAAAGLYWELPVSFLNPGVDFNRNLLLARQAREYCLALNEAAKRQ